MTVTAPGARSIRARLYLSLVCWLLPMCAFAGGATYLFVRATLTAQFDNALAAKASALVSLTHLDRDAAAGVDIDLSDEMMPEFGRRHDPEYFEIWESGEKGQPGRVLLRSPSLGGTDLPREYATVRRPGRRNVVLPDGRDGRAVWQVARVYDDDEATGTTRPERRSQPVVIAIARDRDSIDDALEAVLAATAVAGGVTMLLSIVAAYGTIAVALRPVRDLGARVSSLDPRRLPEGLGLPPVPSELGPVVRGLDGLIGRVNETIARERRFASSAAHELRTPLAEARSLLEVREQWPDDVASCLKTIGEVRVINERMERLTALLLDLARAEGPEAMVSGELVDIGALVRAAVARSAARSAERRMTFELTAPVSRFVESSRAGLDSILANLVDNAVEHAPQGSAINIEVTEAADKVALMISNPAPGLSPEDVARAAEPFWRKDSARTAGSGGPTHLGLGLSISRAVAERLGACFSVDLRDGRFVATVEIPDEGVL